MSYFLTHALFMDVFMEVVKVTYRDKKRVKAKVRWWNGGYQGTNPFPIFPMPENREFSRDKWNEFVPRLEAKGVENG